MYNLGGIRSISFNMANSTGKIENAQIAEANRMMQRIWQLVREKQ